MSEATCGSGGCEALSRPLFPEFASLVRATRRLPDHAIMKFRILAVALAFLSLPAAVSAQTPDRLRKILASGVLRVGTTMDTPVFSMPGSSGDLVGFDIDLLATLGPALGVKIQYVKMTFGSMLADLAADKFDVAMSGMGRTLDRARVATFPSPTCAMAS